MSKIDTSRLTAIFRSLSASESDKSASETNKVPPKESQQKIASVELKKSLKHDKEELKKNISLRLSKLKPQDKNFHDKAHNIVIKEILLWEFGDGLLQHPEFQLFSQSIIDQVKEQKDLNGFLNNLIVNFQKEI